MFSTNSKSDFAKIPLAQDFHIRLLIRMSAHADHVSKRPQLNLALVLDRSGSMTGDKISYVKMAASNLISRLAADDIYSVTIFDHYIDVLIPPVPAGNLSDFKSIIDGVEARGSTYLCGGFQKGFDLIKKDKTDINVSRILLLTDGLANVGVTDLKTLSGLAEFFKTNSVTTTTVGAGEDYDETLLGAIAHSGGGNTYFIENPDDAPGVFEEELGYLLKVAALDVSVSFTSKISGLKFAQMNNFKRSDAGVFEIGDLYSGQEKILMLELDIPRQHNLGNFNLGEIKINFRDVNQDGLPMETTTESVSLCVVTPEEFSLLKADREVTLKAALLFIANTKSQMMNLANQGRFEEAAALAETAITMLENLGITDALLESEIRDLKIRAKGLREGGRQYYSKIEQKRMFYESQMRMKSSDEAYNQMLSRRKDS